MQGSTSDLLQSLVARVERLEKQYGWLKSEVVTEKFVLADSDGKTKASLGLASDGVPTLILFDANGYEVYIPRSYAHHAMSFAYLEIPSKGIELGIYT
jgi:hypothetical protein